MNLEILHIAKIGSVTMNGASQCDAVRRLTDYLQSFAGKQHFCEGLDPAEAEERYQEALFQLYDMDASESSQELLSGRVDTEGRRV